jgi:hypothetical protein
VKQRNQFNQFNQFNQLNQHQPGSNITYQYEKGLQKRGYNMLKNKTGRLYFLITALLIAFSCSGCVRYAKNVSILYEPITTVRGGNGTIQLVSSPDQQTKSENVKWVIGIVKNDENMKIDEILSPLSATEIVKDAFAQELKRTGYSVVSATVRSAEQAKVINLAGVDVKLDQLSDVADIKATCSLVISLDFYKNGQLVKKLQYQSKSSETAIKDRNLLANKVLHEAIQSAMQQAVPDVIAIFEK